MYLPAFIVDRIPDLYLDFEGQRLAEQLYQWIIVSFSIVGFLWGFYCQQFSQTLYVLAAGIILSCLLVLPPWPMFRRNPVQWAPSPLDVDSRPSGKRRGKR
ncbi:signal peptidase complex subunit 1-like [Sycon ciliatum]|uniref:signal peptidase complex subunit 1-like n=1 Tax=Sycon ciliatum TaxID=27933 RepID=UPI0020A8DEA9|eukprot:scpid99023/ scgid29024/ Signal peptidase complex subunit 1; Microsomal signal peptidase 12 kDa subunit